MFYRVEYPKKPDGSKVTGQPKKEADKKYVDDSKNKDKLISTSVAETPYIKNVIDVFVRGNDEEKKLNQLYTEPGEDYK